MSMMKPLMHLTLPDIGPNSVESHFAPLVLLMEGPIAVNQWHIERSHRRVKAGIDPYPIPWLFESGVRYRADDQGREDWRDCLAILDRWYTTGLGADCDNLVCWRVAELRAAGIKAKPVIKWQHLTQEMALGAGYRPQNSATDPIGIPKEGLWMVHCCVQFPDKHVEDTSALLGMSGEYTDKF